MPVKKNLKVTALCTVTNTRDRPSYPPAGNHKGVSKNCTPAQEIADYLGIADFISAIVTPSVALAIELSSSSEPCI